MSQVGLLAGVYTTDQADFVASYPINLEPVITETGLSKGYLRTVPGITELADGLGPDRGAVNWQGICYRASGTRLVSVVGSVVSNIGDIGGTEPVSFDYSFDRLGIATGGALKYFDGAAIGTVTDPDLGFVKDMIWIDGYFMTTDGVHLAVTDLNDPYSVNPLKYGSAETNPDEIVGLRKVRNEAYAVGRYTIENFQNVGGSGFPFRRNPGAVIEKGAVGTHAMAYYLDTFAFVGSAENEALSVYLAGNGAAVPISTPAIDRELQAVSEAERPLIQMEALVDTNEQRLLIHLPDKTLVYFYNASLANKSPVWAIRGSGIYGTDQYVGIHFCYAEGKYICGHRSSQQIGYLDPRVESQYGETAGWRFDTTLLWNNAKGGILKTVDLTGLPGRSPLGDSPTTFFSYTLDGETWSQEREISSGAFGQSRKRMQWRPKVRFSNYMGMRFRGANEALQGFARLDVDVEALSV